MKVPFAVKLGLFGAAAVVALHFVDASGLLQVNSSVFRIGDALAVLLVGLLILWGASALLNGLQKRVESHAPVHPANPQLHIGRIRFRWFSAAISGLVGVYFLKAGYQAFVAQAQWWLIAMFFGLGLYVTLAAFWYYLYAYSYDQNRLTATGVLLSPRTHAWDDIRAIRSGADSTVLVFENSGKARVPYFTEGRAALLKVAEMKQNDARTPRG